MLKRFLRLLVVIFLLQSTWAVAAQYCEHELGLDAIHFGHHEHEHLAGDPTFDQTLVKADDQSAPVVDNDCPYCHLGAMKSIPTIQAIALSLPSPALPIEVTPFYPYIFPRQPERPNWLLAA
jgi:hypothetical protein